jgi:ABC-2 type transport system ATP-binding protein
MIEVSGLSKRFGAVQALSQVSFTVPKGQIVGFLGANGAGKTTTMDIMCGCIGADEGSVKISGFDITEHPIEAKTRLGYLPDIPPLHIEMRVADFITYSARIHRMASASVGKKVAEVIEKLSLGDVQNRIIGNLSKGFRQRVALAQAIVHDPEVLVLDEPTEGLDPNQILHIRDLIKSLAGQHTIILSSHILSEVQNTCDHIIIIHKGAIVQQGTKEELASHLQSGHLYRLRVGADSGRLVQELNNVTGVTTATLINADEHELEFGIGRDSELQQVVEKVARQVLDGGYGLREIGAKTKSLEEVFYQVTH